MSGRLHLFRNELKVPGDFFAGHILFAVLCILENLFKHAADGSRVVFAILNEYDLP